MSIKISDVDHILQLSTDEGTTLDDTFYFFISSNKDVLVTPSNGEQYRALGNFPGYDFNATLCDGAEEGRSKMYNIWKRSYSDDDYKSDPSERKKLEEEGGEVPMEAGTRLRNDKVDIVSIAYNVCVCMCCVCV
jgi:hypothetical protein